MSKGDLRDQLGSFLKGALKELDTVRDVVVQKSRVGRIQIDVAMLRRRRRDALAELGEAVARLAAAGKIAEDAFPELGAPLAQLEALDEKIAAEEERARVVGGAVAAASEDDLDDDKGEPRAAPPEKTESSEKPEAAPPGGDESKKGG